MAATRRVRLRRRSRIARLWSPGALLIRSAPASQRPICICKMGNGPLSVHNPPVLYIQYSTVLRCSLLSTRECLLTCGKETGKWSNWRVVREMHASTNSRFVSNSSSRSRAFTRRPPPTDASNASGPVAPSPTRLCAEHRVQHSKVP